MSIKQITVNLKDMQKELQAVKAEFSKRATAEFTKAINQIFVEYPQLETIAWTQYSPYFNDGEECTFSVHASTFSNAPADEFNLWGEFEDVEQAQEKQYWAIGDNWYDNEHIAAPEGLAAVHSEFDRILQSSEFEDILHEMFGNHVKVICTKTGIDTEEHDHD